MRALTAVLRAVDNPADRLAIFAALRSPFFGFSDDDLWRFVASGGTLNYLAPLPEDARNRDLLAPAWELLTRLHRLRRVAPPSDVLMALFQRTRALAGFRLRRGGDQALANLWKTVDLARAYEAAGPATLRTVVRFLEEERQTGTEEGDSPVGEQAGAQVEVVTVHKAKGLEYPIVVLADILDGQHRTEGAIVDHAAGEGWLQVGSFHPEGWDDAKEAEKLQGAAEESRLLYVALTRARDHLVIPCLPDEPRKGWALPGAPGAAPPGRPRALRRAGHGHARRRDDAREGRGDLLRLPEAHASTPRPRSSADRGVSVDGGEAEAAAARAAEEAWKTTRRTRRAAGRGAPGTQTVLAEADDRREQGRRPAADRAAASRAEDHAAAFGRLVHALLALPEPLEGDALQQAAQTQRLVFGLSETEATEAAELAERAQTLPAVAAARSADAVHRELPFTCRLDGKVVTGRIDLAYRTDGAWTLIDFKTARLTDPAQAAARYREQMDRYRAALSALTGESSVGRAVPRPHRRARRGLRPASSGAPSRRGTPFVALWHRAQMGRACWRTRSRMRGCKLLSVTTSTLRPKSLSISSQNSTKANPPCPGT